VRGLGDRMGAGHQRGGPALSPQRAGGTIALVSATVRTEGSGAAAVTLGDLLYADPAEGRVAEGEWVRLVGAIAARDQTALQRLYERTHRIVFTLIMRIVNNPATAEELTLDVFHDVWKRAGTYEPSGGTVVGWIMNQARSRAIDRVRFEQRKKRSNPHPRSPDADGVGHGSHEALEVQERGHALRRALAAVLTPDEREAIETAFFCECTYAEVSARLRQPLGTVKTRIRSGMAKLRRALAAEVAAP
jgi:RNA polymerase sigma-70 factor, ECF subfamily